MTPILQADRNKKLTVHRFSTIITLKDGAKTTIHCVRYSRRTVKPRIVAFKQPTRLADWCKNQGIQEAIVGGFFLRVSGEILGDTWVSGLRQASVPVAEPWSKVRGSVFIDSSNELSLGPRNLFPAHPESDMLQAGPMLVSHCMNRIVNGKENEGVSAACRQFDSDITIGRYPRAAIGLNEEYIWSVACDGRNQKDAGLTLEELANVMITLGVHDALNLDGGASATQISSGALRNYPRADDKIYPKGAAIYTAIIFEAYRQIV